MIANELGALGIAGNSFIQDRLYRYMTSQRLHSALIFSGPRSETKLAIIKNCAKMLFCRKYGSGLPFCGSCSECSRIEREIYPDVWVWREPEEETIKIESIRDICHRMALSPIEGACRICIIDDCHRMNTASANAFLKTLEEPGSNRYFWLLTSQLGSLLPTLRSRCLEFFFQPELAGTAMTRADEFEALYTDYQRHKNPYHTSNKLRERADCVAFVHFLQQRLRHQAVKTSSLAQIYEWERLMT